MSGYQPSRASTWLTHRSHGGSQRRRRSGSGSVRRKVRVRGGARSGTAHVDPGHAPGPHAVTPLRPDHDRASLASGQGAGGGTSTSGRHRRRIRRSRVSSAGRGTPPEAGSGTSPGHGVPPPAPLTVPQAALPPPPPAPPPPPPAPAASPEPSPVAQAHLAIASTLLSVAETHMQVALATSPEAGGAAAQPLPPLPPLPPLSPPRVVAPPPRSASAPSPPKSALKKRSTLGSDAPLPVGAMQGVPVPVPAPTVVPAPAGATPSRVGPPSATASNNPSERVSRRPARSGGHAKERAGGTEGTPGERSVDARAPSQSSRGQGASDHQPGPGVTGHPHYDHQQRHHDVGPHGSVPHMVLVPVLAPPIDPPGNSPPPRATRQRAPRALKRRQRSAPSGRRIKGRSAREEAMSPRAGDTFGGLDVYAVRREADRQLHQAATEFNRQRMALFSSDLTTKVRCQHEMPDPAIYSDTTPPAHNHPLFV